MNKQEFLTKLRKGLSGLPYPDIQERVSFYSEMIDDRIEEGLSESEAVSAIGSVDTIISQILSDASFSEPVDVKKKRKQSTLVSILLILGSPVWLSLLIALFSVVISVYIVLWSLIVSLWAIFASIVACAFAGILGGIWFVLGGDALSGAAVFGAGIFCGGLSIFFFYGCRAATNGVGFLTKKIFSTVADRFGKRRGHDE